MQTIIGVHGEVGADCLSRLADAIVERERLWSIKVMSPFSPLSYNYVAPAVRADGTEVILKLGVPHYEIFEMRSQLVTCPNLEDLYVVPQNRSPI